MVVEQRYPTLLPPTSFQLLAIKGFVSIKPSCSTKVLPANTWKWSLFLNYLSKRGNSQAALNVHALLVKGLANPSFSSQVILAEELLSKPSVQDCDFCPESFCCFSKYISYMDNNNIVEVQYDNYPWLIWYKIAIPKSRFLVKSLFTLYGCRRLLLNCINGGVILKRP